MPETDRRLLMQAARAAGEVARGYVGKTLEIEHKPGDAGPVTDADHAVNATLHEVLRSARPAYGWLSEETEDTSDRMARDRVFIVDPIDGTRSFIEGSGAWAHSLAVVENGETIAAAIYLPMKDKLYSAARGQGAWMNDTPIRATARQELQGATVVAATPNFDPSNWRGGVPDMRRTFRPSLAYRLALVAEGRFDAMLTLRPSWEWDIAAGALILREAGARVTDRLGRPLRFNNIHPQVNGVVAAGPALHGQLQDRLAPWPG
ncbi:3'(2'),5'-bisphosphate nucleotidase CysQ [Lutimaribacter sp. EGI FJ00015]|uniref:3'(2'),5'-bisphosphate nucleotidase CysQ n=1 Tax=Lutimaribacter degradans TaxID=2945989 RepID=A0ACC5ZUK4_9RHOB|nr:3'(2'),5'-bisphosphate nucleotidase CysQ [Lutimaribacter sp. EGI FJ00013]MCM2561762.1 3'(2'),5'-bisphosphate nucleotidase CysQ [Lutimaribacter sp. EGI FJ00013]MCO0613206.1 3'(2'),5'-bisphosphate nucleotidase CysQ [Lutimaribacter sp. EGI FJ00015]MCO0635594.1 3'(2'),5'-bisphosphate nucleotidase CysQ [Lutimaribacter sp. EGI FJ00014]